MTSKTSAAAVSLGPANADRGFLFANGFGFGITWPDTLLTRTLVPSSKNRRDILVGWPVVGSSSMTLE